MVFKTTENVTMRGRTAPAARVTSPSRTSSPGFRPQASSRPTTRTEISSMTVAAQQPYQNRSVICKSAKSAGDAARRAGQPPQKLGRDRHPDPRGKHNLDKYNGNLDKANYPYRWP